MASSNPIKPSRHLNNTTKLGDVLGTVCRIVGENVKLNPRSYTMVKQTLMCFWKASMVQDTILEGH